MKKLALLLTIGIIFESLSLAQATAQQPKVLTLQQAVTVALDQNVTYRQALNNSVSAQSGVLAAYGTYLPSISGNGGWTRTATDRPAGIQLLGGIAVPVNASVLTSNNFVAGLSVGYTLFNGFSREANFSRSLSTANSADDQAVRTAQATVFQVQSSYLAVLRNQQLVKVAEENLKRDQQQLERITESNRVGALSIGDVYRQQSQVAQDEVSLIGAQNTYDKSVADLVALVGLDVSDNYQVTDPSISSDLSQADFDATNAKVQKFEDMRQRALQFDPTTLARRSRTVQRNRA